MRGPIYFIFPLTYLSRVEYHNKNFCHLHDTELYILLIGSTIRHGGSQSSISVQFIIYQRLTWLLNWHLPSWNLTNFHIHCRKVFLWYWLLFVLKIFFFNCFNWSFEIYSTKTKTFFVHRQGLPTYVTSLDSLHKKITWSMQLPWEQRFKQWRSEYSCDFLPKHPEQNLLHCHY